MTLPKGGPIRPEATPVTLERATAAVVVLDLGTRCHDAEETCARLMEPVGDFLERVRASGTPVVFTVSARDKGTPKGEAATPLKRRDTEPLLYPDGFDKFVGGALHDFLTQRGAQTVVFLGSATNIAVLYTATTAMRIHKYNVVLPMDGVIADTQYEHEYALHQLSSLPTAVTNPVTFSALSLVQFR